MRKTVSLAALAAAAVVLSGCSLAGDQLPRPDAAISVDGENQSEQVIDAGTDQACEFVANLVQQGASSPTSRAFVQDQVVGAITLYTVAQQAADDFGVSLTDYSEVLAGPVDNGGVEGFADLGEDDQRAVTATFAGSQAATELVAALGQEKAGQDADPKTAATAGLDRLRAWLDDHPVSTNPRWPEFTGVDLAADQQGNPVVVSQVESNQLSVAVSDEAVGFEDLRDPQNAGTVDDLPADERCGG